MKYGKSHQAHPRYFWQWDGGVPTPDHNLHLLPAGTKFQLRIVPMDRHGISLGYEGDLDDVDHLPEGVLLIEVWVPASFSLTWKTLSPQGRGHIGVGTRALKARYGF